MRMKKFLYTAFAVIIGTAMFTGYGKASNTEASEYTQNASGGGYSEH